jgi:Omp85 superfamily domain
LFKRDSSFLNIDAYVGAQLNTKKYSKIQLGVQLFSSNIISVDTVLLKQAKQLPAIADIRSNVVNVSYLYNSINKSFNPNRGLLLEVNGFFGNKKIVRNSTIAQIRSNNFNFSSLYDSVQLHTYQVKLQTRLQYLWPIKKQQLLVLQQNSGLLESGNYFTNELFRIGGIKLLRGFDEESILTNRYAVFSTAYRLLLGNSGYFETFTDIGLSSNAVTNKNNVFISAGIALALQSKQGILNIALANGKQNDLPFNFRQTKLHIGFVSLF